MPKKPKRKRSFELPYWPSTAFMRESVALLKKKGMKGTKYELEDKILVAYHKRRAELLAEKEMNKYESA